MSANFKVVIDDISDCQACLNWQLPKSIIKTDLTMITLTLFKDGQSDSYKHLNQAQPNGPQIFEDVIEMGSNYPAECYTFSGL